MIIGFGNYFDYCFAKVFLKDKLEEGRKNHHPLWKELASASSMLISLISYSLIFISLYRALKHGIERRKVKKLLSVTTAYASSLDY